MRTRFCSAAGLLALAAALAAAQGTVSYRLDGQPFSFKDARLEYHPGDGYFSLDCERQETVTTPDGVQSEVFIGMSIELAGDPQSLVGLHEADSPDQMPVYSFGAPGQIVRESFRGTLFDADGELHTVSDGLFAVPRTDVTE